jgi:hypothetical protein
MNKSNIRVTIDSTPKQQKAIQILNKHGETISNEKSSFSFDEFYNQLVFSSDGTWSIFVGFIWQTEITLDQLDELLKNLTNE